MDHDKELIDITKDAEEDVIIIDDDEDLVKDDNVRFMMIEHNASDNDDDYTEMTDTEELTDEFDTDKSESRMAFNNGTGEFVTDVNKINDDFEDDFIVKDDYIAGNSFDACNINEIDDILYKSMKEIAKFDPALYPDIESENVTMTMLNKQTFQRNAQKQISTAQIQQPDSLPIGVSITQANREKYTASSDIRTSNISVNKTNKIVNENMNFLSDKSLEPFVEHNNNTPTRGDEAIEMKTMGKEVSNRLGKQLQYEQLPSAPGVTCARKEIEVISTPEKETVQTDVKETFMRAIEKLQNMKRNKTTLDDKAENINRHLNTTSLFTKKLLSVCMAPDIAPTNIKERVKGGNGCKNEATGSKLRKSISKKSPQKYESRCSRHRSVSNRHLYDKEDLSHLLVEELKMQVFLTMNDLNIDDQFVNKLFQEFKQELEQLDLCSLRSNIKRLEVVRALIRKILQTYRNSLHPGFQTNACTEQLIRASMYSGLPGLATVQSPMPGYTFQPVLQAPVNLNFKKGMSLPVNNLKIRHIGHHAHSGGYECYIKPQHMYFNQNAYSAPPLLHQQHNHINMTNTQHVSNSVARAQHIPQTIGHLQADLPLSRTQNHVQSDQPNFQTAENVRHINRFSYPNNSDVNASRPETAIKTCSKHNVPTTNTFDRTLSACSVRHSNPTHVSNQTDVVHHSERNCPDACQGVYPSEVYPSKESFEAYNSSNNRYWYSKP